MRPAECFCETVTGYQAYTVWEDWPRLRTETQAGLASSYDRLGGNNDFSLTIPFDRCSEYLFYASAVNSSLYYSSDQNKLVWKDSGGTVRDLW